MRPAGIKAWIGYRRPRYKNGKIATLAENHLNQNFEARHPNQAWVTDITYIRTYEGWLFLAVIIDLFSRQVVGWSMQPQMHADLVLKALLMAVWRRKPKEEVLIPSDQGTQYTSGAWQSFLKAHELVCSMSRRGNCYDNAVAESFFQLLKRERVKLKIYKTREAARRDIFDYVEMFYNPIRRQGTTETSPRSNSRGAICSRLRVSSRPGSIHSLTGPNLVIFDLVSNRPPEISGTEWSQNSQLFGEGKIRQQIEIQSCFG